MTRSPTHPAPETTILRALLEREDGYVSGTSLARRLSMSRVAVWQHMEKLRTQGFEFEAVRAKGYRLTARPAELNATLVGALLARDTQKLDFRHLETVDSTNDEAARQLAGGREAPFVVTARRQLRGRGRFGRVWHSESAGNLYMSFGFRPQLPPERMQTFTLWMGINVCELIASFAKVHPGLKWPNDILFDGRKAGGMLTEARIDADHIRDLVFGLGLNINSSADQFPEDVAHRASSVSESTRAPLDLNRFAAAMIDRVLDAYDQFVSGEYEKTFAARWAHFDILKGRPVSLLQGSRRISGIANGIDRDGSLLVRGENGHPERFRAGEVTLEKKPGSSLA